MRIKVAIIFICAIAFTCCTKDEKLDVFKADPIEVSQGEYQFNFAQVQADYTLTMKECESYFDDVKLSTTNNRIILQANKPKVDNSLIKSITYTYHLADKVVTSVNTAIDYTVSKLTETDLQKVQRYLKEKSVIKS